MIKDQPKIKDQRTLTARRSCARACPERPAQCHPSRGNGRGRSSTSPSPRRGSGDVNSSVAVIAAISRPLNPSSIPGGATAKRPSSHLNPLVHSSFGACRVPVTAVDNRVHTNALRDPVAPRREKKSLRREGQNLIHLIQKLQRLKTNKRLKHQSTSCLLFKGFKNICHCKCLLISNIS